MGDRFVEASYRFGADTLEVFGSSTKNADGDYIAWVHAGGHREGVLVWFLMEGAGTISAVGYFLTGQPVAAAVMALAIVAFWLCGPSIFAK